MPQDALSTLVAEIEGLARIQREVGSVLARDLGCPRGNIAVVRALADGREMTVGDLSAHLRVDLSVASRQITAAVDAGLVERSTPDEPGVDRRVRTVRLTPAGQAFADRGGAVISTLVGSAFADWTPERALEAAAHIRSIAVAVAGSFPVHRAGVPPSPAASGRAACAVDEESPPVAARVS